MVPTLPNIMLFIYMFNVYIPQQKEGPMRAVTSSILFTVTSPVNRMVLDTWEYSKIFIEC